MARLLVVKVIYFYMIFFSFAAAASLVSEANKLSEKKFLYKPKPFSTHKMTVVLNWVTSCALRKKYQNSVRNMITLPAFQDIELVFSRDMLPWFCFY